MPIAVVSLQSTQTSSFTRLVHSDVNITGRFSLLTNHHTADAVVEDALAFAFLVFTMNKKW